MHSLYLYVFQMSKSVLRIRLLSLNDAAGQPFSNVLLYLKKLTKISTSDGKILLKFSKHKS